MSVGFHEIDEAAYHSESLWKVPMLSSSIAKLICNDSQLHAWAAHPKLNPNFKPEESKERDFGTIAHALLLQGENRAHLIQAADYRTKAAKEERDAARAAGEVPILQCDWERIQPMILAGRRQLAAHKDAKNAFTNGKPERTLVWREPNGVFCKARLDWLHDDHRFIDDLKTRNATANPESLSRTMFTEGWDIQAAFYIRGVQMLDPLCVPQFRFVCLETYEPFALSVVSLDNGALMMAERRVLQAIETFGKCLASNSWPGYPDRTCYSTLPAYLENIWLEKEMKEIGA